MLHTIPFTRSAVRRTHEQEERSEKVRDLENTIGTRSALSLLRDVSPRSPLAGETLMSPALMARKLLVLLLGILAASTLSACVTVRFNEKKRLGQEAMIFDANPLAAQMSGKIAESREGAIGGFNSGGAGGCGCN